MPERTIPTLEEIAAGEGHRFDRRTIEAELAAVLIVHGLRLDALEVGRSGDGDSNAAMWKAAALRKEQDRSAQEQRAEAAERERDEMRVLRDESAALVAEYREWREEAEIERDAARADVERLTAALFKYGEHRPFGVSRYCTGGKDTCECGFSDAVVIAADALKETPRDA